MRFWTKLLLLALVVALLAFLGARLAGVMLDLLGVVRGGGKPAPTEYAPGAVVETPEPIEFSDQDYDAVQGIREY